MDRTLPHASHDDHQALIDIARRLALEMPDLLQQSREIAARILRQHTGSDLEPDRVWWHRWTTASSSSTSFTGWRHWGRPEQSITLPRLVMQRFDPWEQDNSDLLQEIGGFYSKGPYEGEYDERNEVRLLPRDVLDDLWVQDFAKTFKARVDAFWKEYAGDFRLMAKATFLAQALQDRDARRLTQRQFQVVVQAVAGKVTWPVTLQTLRMEVEPEARFKVHVFDVLGRQSVDILRIVDQDGWQYLYVPGAMNAFQACKTDQDLYWWVLSETNMAENRARFASHWSLEQSSGGNALAHTLDLLFFGWGVQGASVTRNRRTITGDVFSFLAHSTRQRMQADLHLQLHSNADLRKQMWLGELQAAGSIFGGFGALYWPIALVLVGAGLVRMGLSIDQAINGRTTAERQQGVTNAILSGVDVLFNAASLGGADEVPGGESPPLAAAVSLGEIRTTLPAPLAISEVAEALPELESNEILDGRSAGTSGKLQGIYLGENGQAHILMADLPYQVRWAQDLECWVIVDPDNPFSFYRNIPVQLDSSGQWQPLSPAGLKGGGKVLGKRPFGRSAGNRLAAAAPLPASPYEVPERLRETLRPAADGNAGKAISGERVDLERPAVNLAYVEFRQLREQLRVDANAFFERYRLPARPSLPEIDASAGQADVIRSIYARTDGMVVGEGHSSVASKRFLIDNMELLAREKVRTLFLEHLQTDYHQLHLDTFARTGVMPDELKRYLTDLDQGFHTDEQARYTFLELVRTANRNHVRIQAIDCTASYRQDGLDQAERPRQKMMNYFAHTIIEADRVVHGKARWTALVGNTHANTYKGVPGIAELEGGIGIRVVDVAEGSGGGLSLDTGAYLENPSAGQRGGFVKCDLHYPMETLKPSLDLEKQLPRAGMFTFTRIDQQMQLVHRSADGSLVKTLLREDGAHIFIERPRWSAVHKRRFDSTRELGAALVLMGLKHVG